MKFAKLLKQFKKKGWFKFYSHVHQADIVICKELWMAREASRQSIISYQISEMYWYAGLDEESKQVWRWQKEIFKGYTIDEGKSYEQTKTVPGTPRKVSNHKYAKRKGN